MSGVRIRHASLLLGAAVLGLAACNKAKVAQVETVQGSCQDVNGGNVCTWGEMQDSTVVAFGATVPMAAIENSPPDVPMTWPPVAVATIALPAAVTSATSFDNMTMYWEAHGHPPRPFLTPHYDFHFNAIPIAEVAAIDCADTTKPAAAPAGYELPDMTDPNLGTLVGACVPKMGMHALLSTELRDTTIFQQTMNVGYYHAKPIFVEPMIARATLLAHQNFSRPIPDVPGRPAASRYPTRMDATYDSTAKAYRFAFSGLTGAATP